MKPLLEFCEQNFLQGSQLLMEAADIAASCDVLISDCLSECQLCRREFFVLFEGERLTAPTPKQLLQRVREAINAWQEEYDM